jgi:hypothetical protein
LMPPSREYFLSMESPRKCLYWQMRWLGGSVSKPKCRAGGRLSSRNRLVVRLNGADQLGMEQWGVTLQYSKDGLREVA